MNAALLPLLPTAIALLAVIVALRGVADPARTSPVAARLAMLYRLVAALLFARLLTGLAGGAPGAMALIATMLVAAWLPLVGLRLVEELVRRHAPRFAKFGALGGAIGFSVVALTVGLFWSAGALIGLAAFQALTIAVMVALLLRGRDHLSRAERATADTFALALAAAIPLSLTDFRALLPDLPLRGGSFAVLLMVLATSRVIEGTGAPRRLIADVALCLGGGGLVGLAAGGDVAAVGVGFALTTLALLIERFKRARAADDGLVAALADAESDDADALLASHPLLSSGRIVEGASLADYPASTIETLARLRVVSDATQDADVRDAARDLLDAHAATHLIRLSASPPRFLAVSAGGFATTKTTDELTLLARLVERAP